MSEMSSQPTPSAACWQTASELPEAVFAAWRKLSRALNPTAIMATLDADGCPHTAPFGSLRAATPRLLRFVTWRGHDTFANLCRDDRVAVALVAPPDLAVSIRGRARVVRARMASDGEYAIVEIDVEEVKNDMVRSVVIESGITVAVRERARPWFDAVLGELEGAR
jgi:hypothetical protein